MFPNLKVIHFRRHFLRSRDLGRGRLVFLKADPSIMRAS